MKDQLDDPSWAWRLETQLIPYLPDIRKWWNNIEHLKPKETGEFAIDSDLPGLYYRFTKSPKKSPIYGIQAFPYLDARCIQMSDVPGGIVHMINYICRDNKFLLQEFQIVEKNNVLMTNGGGQFLAFIPVVTFQERSINGEWVFLTKQELISLRKGHIMKTVSEKALLRS